MNIPKAALVFCWLLSVTVAPNAQVANVNPQVRTRATADGKVTVVEIAAHFVTAIRLPEAVNSVAVGDPALFQVEHSEREPELGAGESSHGAKRRNQLAYLRRPRPAIQFASGQPGNWSGSRQGGFPCAVQTSRQLSG